MNDHVHLNLMLVIWRRRRAFLDRAVELGIVDRRQADALLALHEVVDAEQDAREAAIEVVRAVVAEEPEEAGHPEDRG